MSIFLKRMKILHSVGSVRLFSFFKFFVYKMIKKNILHIKLLNNLLKSKNNYILIYTSKSKIKHKFLSKIVLRKIINVLIEFGVATCKFKLLLDSVSIHLRFYTNDSSYSSPNQ